MCLAVRRFPPSVKIMQSFILMQNTQKRDQIQGGEILGVIFFQKKKCPFWLILDAVLIFQIRPCQGKYLKAFISMEQLKNKNDKYENEFSHSVHWGITPLPQKHPPSFFPTLPPPLKSVNCQSPPFQVIHPYILVFCESPHLAKNQIFQ